MKDFKLLCKCNSENTGVLSCEEGEMNSVIITYICNNCGHCEEVVHYLYRLD